MFSSSRWYCEVYPFNYLFLSVLVLSRVLWEYPFICCCRSSCPLPGTSGLSLQSLLQMSSFLKLVLRDFPFNYLFLQVFSSSRWYYILSAGFLLNFLLVLVLVVYIYRKNNKGKYWVQVRVIHWCYINKSLFLAQYIRTNIYFPFYYVGIIVPLLKHKLFY